MNKNLTMGLLDGKVVLITGASRGIGKSIAEECVNQGADLFVALSFLYSTVFLLVEEIPTHSYSKSCLY